MWVLMNMVYFSTCVLTDCICSVQLIMMKAAYMSSYIRVASSVS